MSYGWETWSLTLREEHSLNVFENRGELLDEREKVAEEWGKLHNERGS